MHLVEEADCSIDLSLFDLLNAAKDQRDMVEDTLVRQAVTERYSLVVVDAELAALDARIFGQDAAFFSDEDDD